MRLACNVRVVKVEGLGFGSKDGFCGELELNKLFFLKLLAWNKNG
jgi:hypothetical protein